MSGKGDNYRPVDRERFNTNYDRINWTDDEQIAPAGEPRLHSAPWDDEACDRALDEDSLCLDCMDDPCVCDGEDH